MRLSCVVGVAVLALAMAGCKSKSETHVKRVDEALQADTELAQKLTEVQVMIGLRDDIDRIGVARGTMSAAQADTALRDYAQKLYTTDYGSGDVKDQRKQLESAAAGWFDAINQMAESSTTWPDHGAAQDWQPLAKSSLDSVRNQIGSWLQDGLDPAPLLERAAKVAGWAQGQLRSTSPFAGHDARVIAAMPSARSREILAAVSNASTSVPSETAPASTANTEGARPIPGEMGGARPIPGEMGMPSQPASNVPPAPALGSPGPSREPPPMSDVRSLLGPGLSSNLERAGMELNVDHPGMELTSMDLDTPDPTICQFQCQDTSGCKFFTFIRPGVRGPRAWCSLKSDVPPPQPSNCCVSGRP